MAVKQFLIFSYLNINFGSRILRNFKPTIFLIKIMKIFQRLQQYFITRLVGEPNQNQTPEAIFYF